MLSSTYIGKPGQSIYDVCLMVYGSVDYLVKLCDDNSIVSIDNVDATGKVFLFDSSVIGATVNYSGAINTIYATLYNT